MRCSVDPTLHRLSTPVEIAQIKRRAAPKLFRTRRLANGELVRFRAGPAVEARFRETREDIAESRRYRGLGYGVPGNRGLTGIAEGVAAQNISRSWRRLDDAGWDTRGTMLSVRSPGWSAMPMAAGRRASGLSVASDVPSAQSTYGYAYPGLQAGVNGSYHAYGYDRVQAPIQAVAPMQADDRGHVRSQMQGPSAPIDRIPLASLNHRLYQSCPASLHTSPIPSRAQLVESWNQFNQTLPPTPITSSANIASPAAPHPFQTQDAAIYEHQLKTGPMVNGTVSDPPTRWVSNTASPQMGNSIANPSREGEPHTIDPRWVSPFSSLWTTPAASPRVQSPSPLILQAEVRARASPNHQSLPTTVDHIPELA